MTIEESRQKRPLVHCITNYVTVQDVANMILACGGAPIMADDPLEAAQITAAGDALVLNIGTLQEQRVASMLVSGHVAMEKGIPVILDPVGIGASEFRNRVVLQLLEELEVTVLRGNYAEVAFLAGKGASVRGVDSAFVTVDRQRRIPASVLPEEIQNAIENAQLAAKRYHCLVVMTGATDVITDGGRVTLVANGVPQMSQVTGTGCMLSGVVGTFTGANKNYFEAAVLAVTSMGIAGELSWEKYQEAGLGSFRIGLFDAMSRMDDTTIRHRAVIRKG